jgi:hypothetical protein
MGTDIAVITVVILARLLLPLFIPRWPLPGILLCLAVDGMDQTLFETFTRYDLTGYQSYDKALDVYYLVIAYLSTLRNWQNPDAFKVSRFLIYYRLVGVVLFELFGWRPLLLIFPNTFEYFFIAVEGVRMYWRPARLSRRAVLGLAAGIWVCVKLPQEWWIHVAQLDATDALKAAATDRPWLLVALAVAMVLLVLPIRYLVLPRLPERHHARKLAADPLPRDVDEPQEQRAVFARTSKPWHPVTLEKIALITLVTLIFARILPGFSASPLRLAISVAVVVTINAGISYWMAHNDLGFGHFWKQFLFMAVVNAGLAALGFIVLTRREDPANIFNTLFLMLLFTLLVTLYDRFRPIYSARFERAKALSPRASSAHVEPS